MEFSRKWSNRILIDIKLLCQGKNGAIFWKHFLTIPKKCRGRNMPQLILWDHQQLNNKIRQNIHHIKNKTSNQYHWWTETQ